MNGKKEILIGIGKTKFNSSVCLIPGDPKKIQIWLSERLSRKKSSGEWPSKGLKLLQKEISPTEILNECLIAENRDVQQAEVFEEFYNEQFPFYDFLIKNNLQDFSKKFNPLIKTETHHEAHAYSALAISPFEKAIIVVMDGAGSQVGEENKYEECSVFLQDKGTIKLVFQRSIKIVKSKKIQGQTFSNGVGLLYEKLSEFIFNSSTSAGKVMGLAPFGKATTVEDRIKFQEELSWENSFKGKSKAEWENSSHYKLFCDLAATVQKELEKEYDKLLDDLRSQYPQYKNLILTGGCALNCTNNAKILEKKMYERIFIPPFPGDESIGHGLANLLRLKNNPQRWEPTSFENQTAYYGPFSSLLSNDEIEKKLKQKCIDYHFVENNIESAADDLVKGKVVGWFQGRSESGPRALGNRSILARADKLNLKNYLNENIKFRESFRPYGCSVPYEYSDRYFEVEAGFDNPFMSFAVKIKEEYKNTLKEVSHVDGTSRMQTVRKTQNELFYDLLMKFGERSKLYCLLNTSLNIMGEPIVETVDDAIFLFENTTIDLMYIGKFRLFRK